MERTIWTDERIDDAFTQLREELREGFRDVREEIRGLRGEMHAELRDVRGELAQMKLFMLGSYVTILAAIVATNA